MANAAIRVRETMASSARLVAFGVLVALACAFSIAYTRHTGPVSSIWVANGLLTGTLLATNRRLWPAYIAVTFVANVVVRSAYVGIWYVDIGLSAANVLEASIVAFAMARFVPDSASPRNVRRAGKISFGCNLLAAAISAVIAASIHALAGRSSFLPVLGTWFAAHVLGMAIFATLTVVALRRGRRLLGKPGRRLEFALTLALLAAVCIGVFTHASYAVSFLIYPPLIYCVFRHRFDGVVWGIGIVVVISMTLTLFDPTSAQLAAGLGETEDALLLQLFLAVACLVTFPLAITLTESRALTRGLRESEHALAERNSELHSLNEKLVETQTQLSQSDKMASIGQLAAGVAHEINNPIGYVRSNLRTLSEYVQDIFSLLSAYESAEQSPADAPKPFEAINALKQRIELDYIRHDMAKLLSESIEGVTRVEKIVKDLKDFSRIDEAEWQHVSINDCIDSTLNVVWHELKYKAELVKQYGDLPPVHCLPFQLQQVFLNLLINAAQAIEQRGKIIIRTGRDDDHVWITIADTGCGIAPQNMKRIFEPFFTTKPVGTGTGLGLSVSYGIIKKHGGTIEAASVLGEGTTFTIRLPIDAAPPPADEGTAKSGS